MKQMHLLGTRRFGCQVFDGGGNSVGHGAVLVERKSAAKRLFHDLATPICGRSAPGVGFPR